MVPQFDLLIEPQFYALKELGGQAHIREIEKRVAKDLKLSNEDIQEIHRGNRTKLAYRLAWARFYLKECNLIKKIYRGTWSITDEGLTTSQINFQNIIKSVREKSKNEIEIESESESDLDEDILLEEDNPDVEKEDNSELSDIKDPFDPKLIDIKSKQMMLKALFDRLRFNEINLFTDFQRQGDLWDITKQSRLIESILIRFPLPAFYFDGTNDSQWLVVDGLQRISALRNFVIDKQFRGKPFHLKNLEFLKNLEDCTYDDLPRDLKRRIDETEITIYVISPGTPDMVKYNLFKRINTSGLILEPQEIRHALNQGIPATFVKELAELEEFKKATNYSIRSDRMLDRDFVTRFVSFYLNGYQSYEPDLDSFLNKGMADVKNISISEREGIKENFRRAMNTSYNLFDVYAFRKRYSTEDSRKPINKALFEVWSVGLAKITVEKAQTLIDNKRLLVERFINLLNADKIFEKAITSTTGDKTRVAKRFSEIENLINSI